MTTEKHLRRRIDASLGKILCDLVIKNVTYLDVFSCCWRKGSLSIIDGVMVGLEPGLKGKREIEGKGKFAVPGFIDAHVHVESSMMLPHLFEKAVFPKGTTTAICDPHELANVKGPSGIDFFLNASKKMSIDLWIMLSSCVPATELETNGGGKIGYQKLLKYQNHPRVLGLAEMMDMRGVLESKKDVLRKISKFSSFPIDGHAPKLTGRKLTAYIASGISSCHESTELFEAEEKLIQGMSVWIREGSVAKDLHALYPLLNLSTSMSIGFCTDDRNPLDIEVEGHVDHLVREAIRLGVSPEVAFRSSSFSVANHYGLNRGFNRVGAIAPGFVADLVLLNDIKEVSIHSVFKRGKDETSDIRENPSSLKKSVRAKVPETADLVGLSGMVHTIGIIPEKILTDHLMKPHDERGVHRISVLERHGKGLKPANGHVLGFGDNFKGALASSVGHDSHNLITVGTSTSDMRIALASLIEVGGGFSVVQDGKVLERLPLPFGGLMTDESPTQLKSMLVKLKNGCRKIGCELKEPFLQLAFLSLPVIPSLKITDRGMVDVEKFTLIS